MPSKTCVVAFLFLDRGVQGVPCSVIIQHLDLPLRLNSVLGARPLLRTGAEHVEARVEHPAMDYNLLCLFSHLLKLMITRT